MEDGTIVVTLTVGKGEIDEASAWAAEQPHILLRTLAQQKDLPSTLSFYSLVYMILREREQWLKTKDVTNVVPFGMRGR